MKGTVFGLWPWGQLNFEQKLVLGFILGRN
jgi:hypothetical protein